MVGLSISESSSENTALVLKWPLNLNFPRDKTVGSLLVLVMEVKLVVLLFRVRGRTSSREMMEFLGESRLTTD